MKNVRRIVIVGAALAFGVLPTVFLMRPAGIARAATTTALVATAEAASNCTITPADVNTITAASLQSSNAELIARKTLLMKVIACAKSDAQGVQANLAAIATTNDAEKAMRDQFSSRLDDTFRYYDAELGKLDGARIVDTEAVAREVYGWRQTNYVPLAGQVANFTIWTRNQNLFTAASARVSGIKTIVAFIEGATPNGDLQSNLNDAEALIQNANSENQAAGDALLHLLPPDQSLSLIAQSLQSLSDAYAKFFEISTVVQKLLPTQPSGQ